MDDNTVLAFMYTLGALIIVLTMVLSRGSPSPQEQRD